jgi:hypothetical protein
VWWFVWGVGIALSVTGVVLYSVGADSQPYFLACLVIWLGLETAEQETLRTRRGMAGLVGVLAIGGFVAAWLLVGR